jgi:hypothetical protein
MELSVRQQNWVDDLRSGRYVQGRNVLRQQNPETGADFNCCLGVACVRAEREEITKAVLLKEFTDKGTFEYDFRPHSLEDGDDGTGYMPRTVVAWLDMKNERGGFTIAFEPAVLKGLERDNGIENDIYWDDYIRGQPTPVNYIDLAILNDAGFNFLQIAQFIEDNAHRIFYEQKGE